MPPVYDRFKSKLLLRVLTYWTVWRKTGDFSRSVIDGCWSQGTSQLSHVFSDATDQERRELLVVGTEGCGAQMRLPSYFKPADLNKGEALTAGQSGVKYIRQQEVQLRSYRVYMFLRSTPVALLKVGQLLLSLIWP